MKPLYEINMFMVSEAAQTLFQWITVEYVLLYIIAVMIWANQNKADFKSQMNVSTSSFLTYAVSAKTALRWVCVKHSDAKNLYELIVRVIAELIHCTPQSISNTHFKCVFVIMGCDVSLLLWF